MYFVALIEIKFPIPYWRQNNIFIIDESKAMLKLQVRSWPSQKHKF